MRLARLASGAAGLAAALLAGPAAGQQDALEAARAALLSGDYAGVATALEGQRSGAALELRARALSTTGEYEEALALLGGETGPAPSSGLETLRGEILLELGRWDDAGAAWRRAVDREAPNAALALLRQAELMPAPFA